MLLWTVNDLINPLPGNSSVNTVQHATIDEGVFYVVRAKQRWNNGVMQPVSKQRLGKDIDTDGDFRGVCAECL
jgi:hypothetical protein